jgi:hypothetical protein
MTTLLSTLDGSIHITGVLHLKYYVRDSTESVRILTSLIINVIEFYEI